MGGTSARAWSWFLVFSRCSSSDRFLPRNNTNIWEQEKPIFILLYLTLSSCGRFWNLLSLLLNSCSSFTRRNICLLPISNSSVKLVTPVFHCTSQQLKRTGVSILSWCTMLQSTAFDCSTSFENYFNKLLKYWGKAIPLLKVSVQPIWCDAAFHQFGFKFLYFALTSLIIFTPQRSVPKYVLHS